MSNSNLGHFGLPALLLAVLGLAALVVHLAAPYAHVDYENDLDKETNQQIEEEGGIAQKSLWMRGDVTELYDAWEDRADRDVGTFEPASGSSPGTTLAGTILILIAGIALVVVGFVPLTVTWARWIGWSGATLGVIGGTLAFFSSMFWVGSGFGYLDAPFVAGGGHTGGVAGLVELFTADNAGAVWVISPLIVAAIAVVVLVASLRLMANMIPKKDGLRAEAALHLRGAHWGIGFLAVALVVPFAMAELPEVTQDGPVYFMAEPQDEVPADERDRDYFFFGAHSILNIHGMTAANEVGGDTPEEDAARGSQWWNGLAYTLKVFFAAGWIAILAGVLGSLAALLRTTPIPDGLTRIPSSLSFVTAAMIVWSFVMLVLALSTQWKPHSGVEYDWDPAWFPFALLPVVGFWAWKHLDALKPFFLSLQQPAKKSSGGRKKVNFS